MLIRRVAIQGFKTFAKKTEFVFDPGVTAIVGPNGSGKSNIVDAIRWCLGEQSFSLLRSKKTSDVIFSGSEQKARLGMAQVTLTLDNSQGELPLDFTEVEITRRAYRDGDNEYILNGQRVRLQDITDVLAQTGLGRRTYALIGQGLIDKVLGLAPEELRSLFEEAAGITGYQAKRATALRRLDATQQNLTRVQDIVAELSPRLGYLRRQAERARERAQIADDLRDLLRDWYGYHWHTTLNNLEQRHREVTERKASVEAFQKDLVLIGKKIAGLRDEQSRLRLSLGELHRESSQVHKEAEQVGRELAVAQERLRQIQARAEEGQRELSNLRLQRETLSDRITDTTRQLDSAQSTVQQRQVEVDAVQAAVAQRQASRARLQESLSVARRRLSETEASISDHSSRLRQLEERRSALKQERASQDTALSAAQHEAAELARKLLGATEKSDKTAASVEQFRTKIEEIEEEIRDLRVQQAQVQNERQAADREMDRLQTRLDLLQRLHNEGAGYANGVRAVLQHAQSTASRGQAGELTGILGTVASLVRVPADLDKAIETALGGAFQNVIARSWNDAQSAINYLKTSGHGRATFLPLDRLYVPSLLPAPATSDIIGNAAELIDYDPEVVDAVAQLLNRVWVARDLPAARRALDAIKNGPRPTIVTTDGEIVRPGGSVTGGSDRSRRDDSILARERELRELPDQLDRAAATAKSVTDKARNLVNKVEEAVGVTDLNRQQLGLLESEAVAQNKEIEELRRRQDRAKHTQSWHGERLSQLDLELSNLTRQEQELRLRLNEMEAEFDEAQRALGDTEQRAEEAGADDLLTKLADVRAQSAEARGELQSQQALLESQQRNLKSIDDQLSFKTAQLAQLETDLASLADSIRQLDARESQLSRQIGELQARIQPHEAKLESLESEQSKQETNERAAQEGLRKEEAAWNNAQLQFQRTEDSMGQLRHDIEHDLGLVLLESGEDLAYQPPLPWDAIVEQLPAVSHLPDGLDEEVKEMRARLSRVSNVNPDAPREYEEAAGRHDSLLTQSTDLEAAIGDLRKVIRELDGVMETELQETFSAVAEKFIYYFQALFNGGTAKLVLADPDDITRSGIEIIARPPGKRPQSLALLSGGERTLAACALIFAILRVSPTPFCVLDEVDAALDEANVDRFRQTVTELSDETQFIIITHNRRTLEGTNAIYGITMASDGASRVISLRLSGEKIVRGDIDQRDVERDTEQEDDELTAIEEIVTM